MVNLPDPMKPVGEFLSPIGRVLVELGKLRGSAYNDLLQLPATDPMKAMLARVDLILGDTEEAIIRAAKRPPGIDPLKYLEQEMSKLEEEIRNAQATPGEIVKKILPSPRRRLK